MGRVQGGGGAVRVQGEVTFFEVKFEGSVAAAAVSARAPPFGQRPLSQLPVLWAHGRGGGRSGPWMEMRKGRVALLHREPTTLPI